MDHILNSAIFSFKTFVSLYENNFLDYVTKYPQNEKDLEEEKKYIQILQFILNDVSRYSKFLNDDESYLITFRISSYIFQISSLNLPKSSKIHKLLLKINDKLSNRS